MLRNTFNDLLFDLIDETITALPRANFKKFVVMGNDELVYISKDIAKFISESANGIRDMINYHHVGMRIGDNSGTVFSNSYVFKGKDEDLKIDTLAINKPLKDGVTHSPQDISEIIHTLNHELGHIVTRYGWLIKKGHLAECAADAFAALRAIQLGTYEEFKKSDRYNKAGLLTLGNSPKHYTSVMFQKIETIDESYIKKLSLKQTKTLAENIARKYSYSNKELNRLSHKFNSTAQMNRKDPYDKQALVLEHLIIALDNRKDPDLYNAARIYLQRKDRVEILKYLSKTNLVCNIAIKQMKDFESKNKITFKKSKIDFVAV